jgi:hypothetical protein
VGTWGTSTKVVMLPVPILVGFCVVLFLYYYCQNKKKTTTTNS